MSGDFYKEWRSNAEIDYYPQLVILWLSTNSWYRSHYSEIPGRRDRDFLNKLREDHSSRNKLFTRFDRLLQAEGSKERVELLNHIEGLYYALNSATLLWEEENGSSIINFNNCLLNPSPKTYGSLLVRTRERRIKFSNNQKLIEDKSALFNALLEIIYKVRCLLVHGQMEPNRENHEVVKQCYFLLQLLMHF